MNYNPRWEGHILEYIPFPLRCQVDPDKRTVQRNTIFRYLCIKYYLQNVANSSSDLGNLPNSWFHLNTNKSIASIQRNPTSEDVTTVVFNAEQTHGLHWNKPLLRLHTVTQKCLWPRCKCVDVTSRPCIPGRPLKPGSPYRDTSIRHFMDSFCYHCWIMGTIETYTWALWSWCSIRPQLPRIPLDESEARAWWERMGPCCGNRWGREFSVGPV